MTDQPASPEPDPTASQPTVARPTPSYAKPSAPEPVAWTAPTPEPASSDGGGQAKPAASRPEIAIGGAFAGGFAFAMILKRLAR